MHMESFEARALPQFRSPQEEIAFLRAQVMEKESALKEAGIESTREAIADEAVRAYKQAAIEDVLHPSQQLSQKEQEQIVLRLAPETHDSKKAERVSAKSRF